MLFQSFTLALLVAAALGQAVDLGTAGNFAILSKSGISTVPPSVITGNIGTSPIAAHALTGFSLSLDPSTTFSTSTQVVGNAYAADYTWPTPPALTTAVSDMETAYTTAAGAAPTSAANINVLGGLITGTTFTPGVYKWGTDVAFSADITLTVNGTEVNGTDALFIFQISKNLILGSGANVILEGGIKAANIVWQVAGYVDAGTTSHMEGIVLVFTNAAFKTGSSINGRILSQTAVTLDSVTVTEPTA
jgi:hypothetical protein